MKNNKIYQSHYTSGIRIHDISKILNRQLTNSNLENHNLMTETAYYDTYEFSNSIVFMVVGVIIHFLIMEL